MTLGAIIKAFREEHEMSMEDFSKASGISKAYVSLLEKNRNPQTGKPITPSIKSIKLAANAMGCDFDQLFKQLEGNVSIAETESDALSLSERRIIEKYRALDEHGKKIVDYILDEEYERSTIIEEPVSYNDSNVIHYVGRIAAAGKGVYIDGIPGEIIKVKNKPLDASFAIGVTGDSMEPDYYDGDVVYVHKQSEIEFGEIGLWQIGNEFFIKEYHPEGLKSSNPNYPIMPASPDIRLIGKVIGTVRQ